jgi:hypothetical protein
MIFFNKDEEIINWVHQNSFGIFSRCGLGDLLILKDFATSNELSNCLFRNNKQFLHVKFLSAPINNRVSSCENFIDNVLKPFCLKLFSNTPNVLFSFDDNMHRHPYGNDKGDGFFYECFAGSNNLYGFDVFPYLNYPDMSDILFDKLNFTEDILNISLNESYVCIHTRYRNLRQADINFFKTLFVDIIGKSKFKIVLIGERESSCNFYSIYNYCVDFLPRDKMIDLTTQSFTSDNVLLDSFIASRSKLSIGFGIGGNLVLNTYTNTPTYSYTEDGFDHSFFDRSPYKLIYNKKTPFLLDVKGKINNS